MSPTVRKISPLNRFKKSAIIAHILYHASEEGGFYGSWLKDELEKHGYELSYGTLYPWLNRLEFSGYLEVEKRIVKGKNRKYYTLTESGEEVFNEIKKYLKELFNELME